MNEFRIELKYGKTGTGCELLESKENNLQEIEKLAIKLMRDNWDKVSSRNYILHSPTCPLPTIRVVQINTETNRKLKDGLDFKTKWR